jgi:hypothetical protein
MEYTREYLWQKNSILPTEDKVIVVSMHSQIPRIRNKDGSETLRRRSDGLTLPYSGPNLTTMLTSITEPLFVLKRIDNNGTTEGATYSFKYVARN